MMPDKRMSVPYKDSCDHCGTRVDRKYWTFNLKQCVVCDDDECKSKQSKILKQAISDAGDEWLRSRGFDIPNSESGVS